jgi:DNA-directed RNA polymerase subunit M/transcription elongation factor TFIIS
MTRCPRCDSTLIYAEQDKDAGPCRVCGACGYTVYLVPISAASARQMAVLDTMRRRKRKEVDPCPSFCGCSECRAL